MPNSRFFPIQIDLGTARNVCLSKKPPGTKTPLVENAASFEIFLKKQQSSALQSLIFSQEGARASVGL
jgi:hypothetical protein